MTDEQSPASGSNSNLNDFWSWLDGKDITEVRPDHNPRRTRDEGSSFGYAITGSGKRRRPSAARKRGILALQKDRCLYCDHRFGAVVKRKGRTVTLRLHWDHFVPFAYGHTNADANWVAACHVCNGIKYCRMFDTVGEAQRFILARWVEKGYEIQHPLLNASESDAA